MDPAAEASLVRLSSGGGSRQRQIETASRRRRHKLLPHCNRCRRHKLLCHRSRHNKEFNFGPDLAVAPAQMSQTPKEILPQIHGKSRPNFGPDALFVYLASNPLLVV